MKTENLLRWGSLLLFLIFAAISCWATEHSFHLLIRWMPETFVWGLTIGFFIVASYGTKLIVDAANYDNYVEHRRRTFWIGSILVLVFWLLMSMPTNTHTFFYKHNIGNVVQDDISTTKKYLSQIEARSVVDSAYYDVYKKVENKFQELRNNFNGINGIREKGYGPYVDSLRGDINKILEAELQGSLVSKNGIAWQSKDPSVLNILEERKNKSLEKIQDEKYKVSKAASRVAADDIRKLDILSDTIKKMVELGSIDEDIITQVEGVLLGGYTTIKNNQKFVIFNNKEDKQLYTAENLETRTKRMLSVIDVWIDFIKGKYPLSFLFYILVSVLVDIAAFLFFDYTFKNRDN